MPIQKLYEFVAAHKTSACAHVYMIAHTRSAIRTTLPIAPRQQPVTSRTLSPRSTSVAVVPSPRSLRQASPSPLACRSLLFCACAVVCPGACTVPVAAPRTSRSLPSLSPLSSRSNAYPAFHL
eukprot:2580243-Pleurochrysis_carterae.AAC.1